MSEESKSYSLTNLEEWIQDAVNADTTPQEVYDTIVDTVKKNMKYHKACYDSSVKLLGLLRGNRNISVHDGITTQSIDGVTIGPACADVLELNNDYYTASMFDLTSPNLDNITTCETGNITLCSEKPEGVN